MASEFELTPMKAFLKHRKEFFVIDDAERYKRVTVKLHAQGVVLRDEIYGSQLRTKKQQATKAGDLLVAEIDAKVGGIGIVPPELAGAIVSSHYFLYEMDDSICHPKYLEYYTRSGSVEQQFQEFVQGSTNYASIRAHHTLELQIPLPPLDEQRRIVARIEELAAPIEEARNLRQQAAEEAKVLLGATKRKLFDEKHMEKWPTIQLGEVGEIRAGTTLGRRLTGPTVRLPYMRVANVQDGYLDLRTVKEVEIRPDEREKWLLKPGDVLLTEGGDWDKLGRGTVWQGEIPDCIHQNHIFRVRVDHSQFNPYYLSALISSPYGKAYFQGASKQTTNLATINQRQLKAFTVIKPPLIEQHRIVAYLGDLQAQVNELTALQNATQAELDALLPSVLDRAFRGEL